MKTFWRRLEDILARRLEDVLKTFLQDVLKTSWRCLGKTSRRRLEEVLKTYGQDEFIGLDQDALKTSSEDVRLGEHIRLDQYVLKTFSRRLLKTKTKDVFKTSSSRQMFAGKALGAKKEYVLKHIKGNITAKEIMRS